MDNDNDRTTHPAWTRGYNDGLWSSYDSAPYPTARDFYVAGYEVGAIERGLIAIRHEMGEA